jgi:methionyl-tRNA synthetase
MKKYYVTTPIYYVNDQPHIGHAYTSIAADVLARYHRMRGLDVFFLTGTDEHGQKVQQAAEERGMSPKQHADLMVENFKTLWKKLGLTHDDFIRTTDGRHIQLVQKFLQKLWEEGKIQKRKYSGWYCTPDERFWTGKDLVEGRCPECGRDVEQIEEENYFFLMSTYGDDLIQHIDAKPLYIMPETRRNEVLGFLKSQPLGDLCISRPKKRLSWGVPLPFDDNYVTYVWFDALLNYYSGAEYLAPKGISWWPANLQLIGKDILATHAVYWSTMLMALGLELPAHIFAHGWWTIEGRKMSKSIGNVVDPAELSERYGNDALRYFLLREVPFGHDGDFSEAALKRRFNTELANDFGNLASRVFKMAGKYLNSLVPKPEGVEPEMKALAEGIYIDVNISLGLSDFQNALKTIWTLVSYTNRYIDSNAPWSLAKEPENEGELKTVIYSTLEALRFLSIYLYPFLPEASEKLYNALGFSGTPKDLRLEQNEQPVKWGVLEPGTRLNQLDQLFPRIADLEVTLPEHTSNISESASETTPPKREKREKKEKKVEKGKDNLIKIEEFMRVEMKTAVVTKAERVEGSEKLIRLEVDSGEKRQVVAGVGKAYGPEELLGRTVVVVTNLKPARLMGLESEGMLLAATEEDGSPVILTTETPVKPGLRIK